MGLALPCCGGGIFCTNLMRPLFNRHVGLTKWSHETGIHKSLSLLWAQCSDFFCKKQSDFITISLFFCCHHPWWDWFSLSLIKNG